MFCHQIVYLVEYKQDQEDLSLIHIPQINHAGTLWVVIFITTDGKGEFSDPFAQTSGFYSPNFTQFLNKHSSAFTWNRRVRVHNMHYSLRYLDVDIFLCQPLIANMFTDNKKCNDIDKLMRDFIDKWYKYRISTHRISLKIHLF